MTFPESSIVRCLFCDTESEYAPAIAMTAWMLPCVRCRRQTAHYLAFRPISDAPAPCPFCLRPRGPMEFSQSPPPVEVATK